MTDARTLDERLAAAGADLVLPPRESWLLLREAEGRRATLIDLYELVARERGLVARDLPSSERDDLARWSLTVAWPGFQNIEGSERPPDSIDIVDYDPSWPARFERWRAIIHEAVRDTVTRIEHVGSTSVPGLPAKPVIDVQLSVADVGAESTYVAQLERVGLQLRSRDDVHRFFRPFPDEPREVHVHACETGSAWERDHMLFRDYLRAHPSARDAYADAKRRAAELWPDDRLAYTDAKTDTILGLMGEAYRWAGPDAST